MTKTMDRNLSNLDDRSASAFLREASIGRQQQAGSLSQSQIESIREGSFDNKIGFEDAKYALMHAEEVWPQAQQALGDT